LFATLSLLSDVIEGLFVRNNIFDLVESVQNMEFCSKVWPIMFAERILFESKGLKIFAHVI